MSKRNKQTDPYELADMSWVLIIFLWFCWWPLGVGFTIGKLIHQKKRQQARDADQARRWHTGLYTQTSPAPGQYNYRPTDTRQHRDYEGTLRAEGSTDHAVFPDSGPTALPRPAARSRSTEDIPSSEQSKAAAKRSWLTPLLLILGTLFMIGGASIALDGLDYLMWGLREYGEFLSYAITGDILPGIMTAVGGAAMFLSGLRKRKTAKQEKLLDTIVGPRDHVTLDELSAASGMNKKDTLKVVQSAIAHGRFGADAYVDMSTRTLIVRGAAPDAPPPKPKKKPAAKKSAAEEDRYQAILRQLREVNEAIPGAEMSAKITRMEQVSARIFELARKDPAKEPQLKKFMDYYLPTSLKLLNTYASLDKQDVAGDNITETKANIENAMDLLITAFENQLDKLFETEALDVSSDIAALQGMLNLDGLTQSNDFTAPSEQWQKDTEI